MDCRFCDTELTFVKAETVDISYLCLGDLGNEKALAVEEDRGVGVANYCYCACCGFRAVLTLTLGQVDMQKAGIRVLFEDH